MTEEAPLSIDWTPVGTRGEVTLKAVFPDGGTYTSKIDILKDTARDKYINRLLGEREGLGREEVEEQLERIAAEVADLPASSPDADDETSLLLDIASGEGVELFHTPGGHDAEAFASIHVSGHRETWAIQSRGFKRWLLSEFLELHGKAPNDQALRSALATVDAKALFRGTEHDVCVRVAGGSDVIWLDLGDSTWQAVRVDGDGYAVIDSESVDVRFTRPGGLLPLPKPEEGTSIEEFRKLVNVSSDADWVLLLGWMIKALSPKGDYPILAVNGEEGSAKSTLCRLVRATIDPNKADLRRPPREEMDLVIAAQNSWIVGFDNLSSISHRLSDALCCLSTGSAFSTRTLYTTKDETLLAVKRPAILNGIPDLATRGDLASRCICLTLEAIPSANRRTQKELERAFAAALPGILGALLRAVSCAIRRQDQVKLPGLARMADLCVWVTAAEPVLGWEEGTFAAAYERRLIESVDEVIEASPIGAALLSLLEGGLEPWVGTSTQLRAALEQHAGESRKPRGWPDTPQKTSNEIRRIAPSLRKKEIPVRLPKKGSNPRLFRIGPLPSAGADAKRAEARASAGYSGSERLEKPASRAPALPALSFGTPDDGEDQGHEARDREFGWAG